MTHSLSPRTVITLLVPLGALLAVFFLWPLAMVGWSSIHDQQFTLKGYAQVLTGTLIHRVLWNTLQISVLATLTSLLLGYAIALHLASMSPARRAPYLIMVMLPFWTSILVKSFAFTVVLGDAGIVNQLLGWLSGGTWHVEMMFNRVGVIVGMTNYLLPFMVLPIMASLLNQNRSLYLAAEIMGAGPLRVFWRITLPLSLPGVYAGVLMCMTLSMGMYITPALLGGRRDMMLANLIDFYTRQTLDWNLASAIAMLLLLLSGLLLWVLGRVQRDDREAA
ncbi:ABC transporter permease [Bordetella sp. BOR01]|uniref:ABC transporter permease n=1 Tax=Bordetella sp. BOR01 TaxID=2854779 RepID=UPI001C451E2A|nr:ABC transporter permease [Bordetella sp. BOR01]MBV7485312.1 ABC transporter permease [Bordetella sp. BOR01]